MTPCTHANRTMTLGAFASLALLCAAGHAGPDLICSEITGAQSYGVVGDLQAFSFGDTTCNIGDAPLTYQASSANHPVFTTALYRLKDGRFEQIGMSFVSHTFFPLQGNACSLGCVAASPGMLGAGCSDATGAAIAGVQGDMGPRIEVDPYTGAFPYPFSTINQTGDPVYKRLKARVADLSDPGALYFVERQYISNEEAPGASLNNASYRRVVFSPGANNPTLLGQTHAQRAAIFAWADHGLGADTPDADVRICTVALPGDGVVHVGSRATDLGDGTWRYDYAVQNQNASRGINALRIPIGYNRVVEGDTFHDIAYIDEVDDQIEGTDWVFVVGGGLAAWELGEDFDQNPLANAIRWGTTYSFSFVSVHPPVTKAAELGVFVDHDGVGAVLASVVAPLSGPCVADLNGDGAINFFDVSAWLNAYNARDLNADLTGDGVFDFFDVSAFLSAYYAGCP